MTYTIVIKEAVAILLVDLLREVLVHCTLEEEPDPVRIEETCRGSQNDQVVELLGVLEVSFQKERAYLGDKELKVISEGTSEIGINSALF